VRLHGDRLKRMADAAGVSAEQLAEAVERTGLSGARARSAVGNWLSGRDHPRAKAADIRRLAESVGCEPVEIVRFTSEVRFHRGSSRKARLVADLIREKSVEEAIELLTFAQKRAAKDVRKALDAAIADAEQNDADVTTLVVAESRVDEGPTIKRFRPKDRGRAHPIMKRTSHITVGVEERN
jgi:large subunit ribosomal protein L22